MVKDEKSDMRDNSEQTSMKKQNLRLNINASCSNGDCIDDSLLCDNVTNGMVTESSGEDVEDEAVEVKTGDVEDSQDDQEHKCEEKETMKTSGEFVFPNMIVLCLPYGLDRCFNPKLVLLSVASNLFLPPESFSPN